MMVCYEGSGTGVDVSEAQQIEYNTWFADEVHAAGMAVALKNAVEMAEDVVDKFDFALNESCHVWGECNVSFFLKASQSVQHSCCCCCCIYLQPNTKYDNQSLPL